MIGRNAMKLRAQLIVLLGFILFGFIIVPLDVNAQAPTIKRDSGKSKKAYSDGAKLYNQKNYRDAIAKFEEAIRYDANNEIAHFYKGYSHYFLKEYDQALAEFNTAEELKYKNTLEIYKGRAVVQYALKNYEGAMADTRRVLQAEPKNLEYIRLSGDVSLLTKNYDDALATYQKVSEATPNDGNLVYAMAQIHAAKGDVDGQAAAAERAIRMGTQFFVEAQLLAADAYIKQGKP